MARRFAVGDNIVCDVGACGPLGTGAYTMVWLYQIPLFSGIGGLGALRRSGAYAREGFITSSGKYFGAGDFDGFGTSPEAVWVWVAQRKKADATLPAGPKNYEWAYGIYPIGDPDTDITFGTTTPGTHNDPGAGDQVYIGLTDVQGNPTRDIAVQAFFASRLSDADIKAAFTTALADLVALGPVGCWPLNQASTADDVVDVTNNGADQASIAGTTVVADPPGYDFSLGSDITLAGTLPALTGSFTVDANNDVQAAGSLPALAGAFTVGALSNVTLAGTLPVFVGYFTDGSDISKGVGRRAIARTPLGRPVQATPVGRSVP